jgi:Mrp family chromosome partitioning ATPase
MNSETIAPSTEMDLAATWQPDAAVSQCFRALYRRLFEQGEPDAAVRVVGVTSCGRGEGVSTVASQLAIAAADDTERKVLLVDANPPAASFGPTFTIGQAPGLLNLARGSHSLQQVLLPSFLENLWVLPMGTADHESPTVVTPRPLNDLFSRLSLEFSFIVVDMAPVDKLGDVAGVTTAVDGIVLVVQAERIKRSRGRAATGALSQIRLLGAVLNQRQEPT